MAFQTRGLTTLLTKLLNCETTRFVNLHFFHHQIDYFLLPTSQIDSKSNLAPQKTNPFNQCSKLDESFVLNQLSVIIPAIQVKPMLENTCNKQLDVELVELVELVDSFLPVEDRLRGVFLQKLCGKSAYRKALDDVGVELDVGLVRRVVDNGNLSGEFMVMFLDWAVERGVGGELIDVYHVVLKALGRRKFFEHMVGLLRAMRKRGVEGNAESFLIVVDSFVRANQVSKAMGMFSRLEEFGFELNVELLNIMLSCLCKRGHSGYASRWIRTMRGKVDFDGTTYNILIGGWARSGVVVKVDRFLQEMVEDGCDPDCLTYGYILEGLGKSGKVDDSVKVFQSLVESGNLLKSGVYNAMIANFVRVGNTDESLNYYHQMIADKCEPDMDTYSRLISALLKVRRVADAIEMFDQMLDRGIVPTTGLVTSFLEPLCNYGPPDAALIFYTKARESGCRISLSAYKLLLSRLSGFGKCGKLLTLWKDMQETGHSSDMEVFEYVINGLCNIGELENAALVMEDALKEGFYPSRPICCKLNSKLLTANKVERAYNLLLKFKAARGNENAQRRRRYKGWHF